MSRIVIVLLALIVARPATAQLAAEVVPNILFKGAPVTLTLTEYQGKECTFLDGCIVKEARVGRPDGPTVWVATLCPDILVPVPPHGSITTTWIPADNEGNVLPPETYWLRVSYWEMEFGMRHQWYPVTWMANLSQAMLIRWSGAVIGQPAVMSLRATMFDASPYVVAASTTTDTGFPLFGGYLHAGLDRDALFGVSFPNPDPALFSNFQGTLDTAGYAAGITVHIPAIPELAGHGFSVQALVWTPVPSGGQRHRPPELSNVVFFTIR